MFINSLTSCHHVCSVDGACYIAIIDYSWFPHRRVLAIHITGDPHQRSVLAIRAIDDSHDQRRVLAIHVAAMSHQRRVFLVRVAAISYQ